MTASPVALLRESWIHRLRPRAEGVVRPAAGADVLQEALELLGPGPVGWAAEAAAGMAAAPLTARGVESGLLALLLQLHEGRAVGEVVVPEAVLDDARSTARNGVPSTVLVEAVWRRHACVQEAMVATLESGVGRSGWDDLLLLTRYSEWVATLLLEAYDDAGTWTDDRAARRREAVGRLLAGEPATGEDEDLVGVRLGGHHLVAVVGGATGEDDPRVGRLARAVAAELPGCALVVADRPGEVVLWWSRSQPMREGDLDGLARLAVPEGLTLALGDPHPGVSGVARGYAEAGRAATVAAASAQRRPRRHADVLLVSALLADPDATRALVARELAGVLGHDRRSVELRQTLLLFLRSGGSRQAVGQELGMAPTTVAYRVDRFERLRGRPLQESRLETWAALTVADLVPSLLDELSGSGG